MVSFFLQIIGASVRYFISFVSHKLAGRKAKSFDAFFKDRGNDVVFNSTNDYINTLIGIITFLTFLILSYLLFG
ncbi:MAG: hypothetical protein CVU03_02385 [Bacteroidetes bacterium HGW-Bacteroidetes-2]|jgi:hypothetical protein|nr:MAG: hypothetical protein CVU13_05930 [Bacteroidetes bacterium HGW-Bacteroidetes-8]PKP26743.1 MAG: hypothetical protein CVU03_02385 [Bacteroidetes bacterium HGW-Bacteroidetes-2]